MFSGNDIPARPSVSRSAAAALPEGKDRAGAGDFGVGPPIEDRQPHLDIVRHRDDGFPFVAREHG
jgi:hypothetical protein